jgi:hypothetical protein
MAPAPNTIEVTLKKVDDGFMGGDWQSVVFDCGFNMPLFELLDENLTVTISLSKEIMV